MSRIRPFKAIIPQANLAAKVVTRPLENYSLGEARLIASENNCSFLHLINPELDNPYLRGTRQELVFKKISENMELFLEHSYIEQIEKPAIFIYRVENQGRIQTGFWTLTSVEDNIDKVILKHEQTVTRREKLLAEYLQQTCLDANPVLITHDVNPALKKYIEKYTVEKPCVDFLFQDNSRHQLWMILKDTDLEDIQNEFLKMDPVYLADGHHRIASMTNMAKHKAQINVSHSNSASYNFFSSVYMDVEEVKIFQFHRLVKDINGYSESDLMDTLSNHFTVIQEINPVIPQQVKEIGMYLNNKWFRLTPNKELFNGDPVNDLDVSILHNHILYPLLGIKDPRTDARIYYEGGLTPVETLINQVDGGNFKIAFTLYPTSLNQIKQVADAGEVMPPKSTWVEPKFLVGLVTNYFA